MSSSESVVDRVRRAVADGVSISDAIASEVRNANERGLAADGIGELDIDVVARDVTGFGVLQPLLDDSDIEEIWINGPDGVFVARHGVHHRTDITVTADTVRNLVDRMLRTTGRRIDYSQPFVDASLPDGSRLHVVIPPITRGSWSVNIRKFSRRIRTLADLVEVGTVDAVAEGILANAVADGSSILIAGATQAGKTTLLTALCGALPETERVISVEETFELALPNRDAVAMQCRGPSLEGLGEVSLRKLVRETLRMRPTRIVVGEVRGDEALDLLVALNSGVPGLCTIHANSTGDAVRKLVTLCQLAGGVTQEFIYSTVVATIDIVVHCRMNESGAREVTEIASPRRAGGEIDMDVVWSSSR